MVKKIPDNEIYLLIKCIKSVLWRVAKRLSYIEDARCLKFKWLSTGTSLPSLQSPYLYSVQLRQRLDNDKPISSSLWQQLSVVTDDSVVLICTLCTGLEIVERILFRSNYTDKAASCVYFVAADCSYMISGYVYV